ncbi:MAG: hypothetical protein V3V47_04380, partial [Desulfobacteria bacterium]
SASVSTGDSRMKCPKSLRKIFSIGELFVMIENVVCAFLSDKLVFVKKVYSKTGIISNVNLPRASPITQAITA